MALSPGIEIREVDATTSVITQLSSNGSFAGKFAWGPVLQRVRVSREEDMVKIFGAPNGDTAVDFLTAASFLAYSSALDVVRIGNDTDMKNAVSNGTPIAVLNDDDYDLSSLSTYFWIAKFPGSYGNSISVSTCRTAAEFETALPGTFAFPTLPRSKTISYTPAGAESLSDYFNVGDILVVDNIRYTVVALTGSPEQLILDRIYMGSATPSTVVRRWAFAELVGSAPALGQLHVVVTDTDGKISSEAGTILESYIALSTTVGAKYEDGTTAYYVDAINRNSALIRVGGAAVTGINSASKVDVRALTGGDDGVSSIGTDEYLFGYDLFKNAEELDAPLIIGGAEAITSDSSVLANYLIENIELKRKDGIVFVSPAFESCVNNRGNETVSIVADRNTLPSTSFAHMDSGWKYMYDKYNDVYRWVPLCGDSAGIYARVDLEADTWLSGAGFARGNVKNVVKLAWSPSQAERDVLYVAGINPVTDFPANGPTLFGDKTLLASSSAFSRMNVRRLFILLEVSISRFAQDLLFEFNDDFTRNRFQSAVEPFLREVKGRRGITDFRVVVDETVNTPAVVQSNRFVGQIFVKPASSISFIRLDFVAVGQTVSFEEVIGQV